MPVTVPAPMSLFSAIYYGDFPEATHLIPLFFMDWGILATIIYFNN
jgi:hypothetical protein